MRKAHIMRTANDVLGFGSADEAAEYLHSANDVSHDNLLTALVNALRCISSLQAQQLSREEIRGIAEAKADLVVRRAINDHIRDQHAGRAEDGGTVHGT